MMVVVLVAIVMGRPGRDHTDDDITVEAVG